MDIPIGTERHAYVAICNRYHILVLYQRSIEIKIYFLSVLQFFETFRQCKVTSNMLEIPYASYIEERAYLFDV